MTRGNFNSPTKGFHTNPENINRKGAPKLDAVIQQIRELEKKELTEQFSTQLRMNKEELREVILNPKTPVKELGIAKGILKWLETGYFSFIQPYIEYIFGKPKETHEHLGVGDTKIVIIRSECLDKINENQSKTIPRQISI